MSAIPLSVVDAQLKRLYEVAQEYRAKEYRVIVGPSQRELPEFLRGFQPDLLVTRDNDRAVVDVKSRRALIGNEAFARMAEVVEQQPDWRLELVLVPAEDEPEEPLSKSGDIAGVRTLLAQAREFGHYSFAIVAAIAAAEHAMVIAATRAGLPITSDSPGVMLKTLFAHGLLSGKGYEALSEAWKVRNEVAHGQRVDVDATPWVDRITPVVEELIALR